MKARKNKQLKWMSKLPQQEIDNLKEVFDLFDEDQGGTVDPA